MFTRIRNNLDDDLDEDSVEDKSPEPKEALQHPASSSNTPPTSDKQLISEALQDENEFDSILATINDGKQSIDAHIRGLELIERNAKRDGSSLPEPDAKRHAQIPDLVTERLRRVHGNKWHTERPYDPG